MWTLMIYGQIDDLFGAVSVLLAANAQNIVEAEGDSSCHVCFQSLPFPNSIRLFSPFSLVSFQSCA